MFFGLLTRVFKVTWLLLCVFFGSLGLRMRRRRLIVNKGEQGLRLDDAI